VMLFRLRAPKSAAVCGAILLLGWVSGCARPGDHRAGSPPVLRVPLPRDVLTLDPARATEITQYNVMRQIYEGLVDYDPGTLSIVPRIARAWSVSEDGLTWVFDLHRGVRFTDDPCFPEGRGREVEAEDARYSIERGLGIFRGETAPPDVPAIADVAGFLDGGEDGISGISVLSRHELAIRLDRPDPGLLHFLVRPSCRIVAREAVEAYGEGIASRAVGTGPFRLASWHPLAGILLVRNRHYWQKDGSGRRLPYLDALQFVPIRDSDQDRPYAEGKIDLMSSYSRAAAPAGASRATTRADQQFFVSRLNTIFIRFDYRSAHAAVRDRRIRLALSYALPRPVGKMLLPAAGLLPPGLPGYDPALQGQRSDPAAAEALLRRAGHSGGKGLPPLRVAWRDWDAGVGNGVAASLRRVGLRVELRFYSDRDYPEAISAGEADLFRAGWIADYPDPEPFLALFLSRAPDNAGRFASPEFDRLFETLRRETDGAARLRIARSLERILVDETAALFLHHERESQFVSPRVENWEHNGTNPLNVGFYERIRIRPGAS